MLDNKIFVTSKTNSTVVINIPELHLSRVWTQKEMSLPIDKEALAEAMYDPAVSYLFKEGLLFVKDFEFKKDVGLEDYEATEEAPSIIDLTDKLMLRMIRAMPMAEFEETLGKLTRAQREELGAFAIEHNDELRMDRIDALSKACGINILKSIENLRAANEGTK